MTPGDTYTQIFVSDTADQQTTQPDLRRLRRTWRNHHGHRHRQGNWILHLRPRHAAKFSRSVTPRIQTVTRSFTTAENPADVKMQSPRVHVTTVSPALRVHDTPKSSSPRKHGATMNARLQNHDTTMNQRVKARKATMGPSPYQRGYEDTMKYPRIDATVKPPNAGRNLASMEKYSSRKRLTHRRADSSVDSPRGRYFRGNQRPTTYGMSRTLGSRSSRRHHSQSMSSATRNRNLQSQSLNDMTSLVRNRVGQSRSPNDKSSARPRSGESQPSHDMTSLTRNGSSQGKAPLDMTSARNRTGQSQLSHNRTSVSNFSQTLPLRKNHPGLYQLASRVVSNLTPKKPKGRVFPVLHQKPSRFMADDLARLRRFHYLASLRRSRQLVARRKMNRRNQSPYMQQPHLRNQERAQPEAQAPRRPEISQKHFSAGEVYLQVGQRRGTPYQLSGPPLLSQRGQRNREAGKRHTDTETQQSSPPVKSLTGRDNAEADKRQTDAVARQSKPLLESWTLHQNIEVGQKQTESDTQRSKPPSQSRGRHQNGEARQRSEPAAAYGNPHQRFSFGNWMSRRRSASSGRRHQNSQTVRKKKFRRPVVAYHLPSKRDDSNTRFSKHHTTGGFAKTLAERYTETQSEGKTEDTKMRQKEQTGLSPRLHQASSLKLFPSDSDLAPKRKLSGNQETTSHDDLHAGIKNTTDDLKTSSKTSIDGSVEDRYRSHRKEYFQSDSPQGDTGQDDQGKLSTKQAKRTDRVKHEQKPQMKSTPGTRDLPGSDTHHTPAASSKSGDFKTKLKQNLRSHLRDPRMQTLFRALGAKRMGQKPPSSQPRRNPAKHSHPSFTSREGSPQAQKKTINPKVLHEIRSPSSNLEAERKVFAASGKARSKSHSQALDRNPEATSREPLRLPTTSAKLLATHQKRRYHTPLQHAPISGYHAPVNPPPDPQQSSPRQQSSLENHQTTMLRETQESSSVPTSAEGSTAVENAHSSLVSPVVNKPSRSAESFHDKRLMLAPQRSSSIRNSSAGLPQSSLSQGSEQSPSSELRQTSGSDAFQDPLESDNEKALNDEDRFPIKAIAVEDMNMPENDEADFSISRKKTSSRLRPSKDLSLAAEGPRNPTHHGDRHGEESSYQENPRETPQSQKDKARTLFPNHQIIDLDIRYRSRPTSNPTSKTTKPPPETSSLKSESEVGQSKPASKDVLRIAQPMERARKPHTARELNVDPGTETAVDEIYEPLTPVGRVPQLRLGTKPAGRRSGSPRSVHDDSEPHEGSSEGAVERVYTPVAANSVRKTTKPIRKGTENENGNEAGTSSMSAVTSEALDGVTDRSCRDDLCRNASQGGTRSVTAVDFEGVNEKDSNPLDVECPPGHRRALRNQYIVCEPLRARFANMTADQLCTEGRG